MLITFLFFSFFLPMSVVTLVSCSLAVSFIFIWIRITFCRFRYDMLMLTSWKVLLPFSLLFFICSLFLFC